MNENLLRYNETAKFCVFDFEAENLNLWLSKPLQFACVVATPKKILKEINFYIKWPEINMSLGAEQVTRFNYQKWEEEGIPPEEAFKIINREFEEVDWIGGHNILGYDISVYRSSCKKLGFQPVNINQKIFDTFPVTKGLPEKLNVAYRNGDSFFHYQMKLLDIIVKKRGYATLKTLCGMMDIHYDEGLAHDALYDVRVNYKAILKLLWKIEI